MSFKIDYNNPNEITLYRAVMHSRPNPGYQLERQHRVNYIDPNTGRRRFFLLDLADPYNKVAIEVDGKQHHTSPEDRAHDAWRQAILEQLGWDVIRFTASRVYHEPLACANEVIRAIDEALYWKQHSTSTNTPDEPIEWRHIMDGIDLEKLFPRKRKR